MLRTLTTDLIKTTATGDKPLDQLGVDLKVTLNLTDWSLPATDPPSPWTVPSWAGAKYLLLA